MAEYIDKQKAIDAITVRNLHPGIVNALQSLIIEIPSADVQPVQHGRWELSYMKDFLVCSECVHYWIYKGDQYDYHFCPNCGADMRGEQDV